MDVQKQLGTPAARTLQHTVGSLYLAPQALLPQVQPSSSVSVPMATYSTPPTRVLSKKNGGMKEESNSIFKSALEKKKQLSVYR